MTKHFYNVSNHPSRYGAERDSQLKWGEERLRAARVIDEIHRGLDVPISMGCKVPYDVCSLCGNQAKNGSEYCTHAKNPGFGAILQVL